MKQIYILLFLISFVKVSLSGQFTGDSYFVIDIIIDNQTTTFERGPCGFEPAKYFGAPVDSSFCRPIVWGYTVNNDSLGCDSLTADYSGKIVMARRGACEFAYKALLAEQAGADGSVIANGYGPTHGDDCTVNSMGVPENAFHQIPIVFFSRQLTDFVDDAIAAGKNPVACFRLLKLHNPTAEYAYATPVAQADTMDLITCSVFNHTDTAQILTARATIIDPNGTVTQLTATKNIDIQGDSLIHFPNYMPPKVEGKFRVIYTVDGFTQAGDTLFREFELTRHTFATDNLIINGGEPEQGEFNPNPHSDISLYKTGDVVFNAGWVAFGINNPGELDVEPPVNEVQIILYDADEDNDGLNNIDLNSMINPLEGMPFVAFAEFSFDASLKPDSILYVPLTSIPGDSVFLKPNHYYYLRLIHNDGGTGLFLSFTTTEKVAYELFDGVGPITPLIFEGFFPNSWPDRTVISRLVDAAFNPDGTSVVKTTPLDRSKFQVSPNPAGSATTLQLDLAAPNQSVEVVLIGIKGEIISRQTFKNFQDGQVRLVTSYLPSGNYGVLVRASEEGVGMLNLVVGH